MATLNAAQIERNLNGIKYPASRADLVRQAERNGADENARQMLSNLPNQSFDSIAAVNRALGAQQGQQSQQGQQGQQSQQGQQNQQGQQGQQCGGNSRQDQDQDADQTQQGRQRTANR